jgi:hypothetical protein
VQPCPNNHDDGHACGHAAVRDAEISDMAVSAQAVRLPRPLLMPKSRRFGRACGKRFAVQGKHSRQYLVDERIFCGMNSPRRMKPVPIVPCDYPEILGVSQACPKVMALRRGAEGGALSNCWQPGAWCEPGSERTTGLP